MIRDYNADWPSNHEKVTDPMNINPYDLAPKDVYKLMTGSIVPRAIAWVSTVSADGVPNLAPFSYFSAVSNDPPTVLFCPGMRGDSGEKDTYQNVLDTGEFVINFVSEDLMEAMNITATELPPHVNEFERAGLTAEPAVAVNVPRVKESPIHFECKLLQTVTIGHGHIVIGDVVHMHFDDAVFRENNYIDIAAYKPLGRLAGSQYTRVSEILEIARLPSELED